MKSVLVLDANQRSALATTRSLGKKGITVITADETPTSLAGSSKYSKLYTQHPSALQESTAFITHIATTCQQHGIDLVFPMTELTTTLLLKHRDDLPELIFPFSDASTINSLADKCQLMQLAASLQIPTPRTIPVSTNTPNQIDLTRLDYPLVLKPAKSWIETDNRWLHTTVRFAENVDAATTILANDPAFHSHPYMLQNRVAGHGEGVFALYDHGKAVAFFAHKRLREKPPRGGVSVLSESATIDPTLLDYSRKILDSAKWHGVAMVEFKVDDDDSAYLMEVNTRFWGSLQLAIDAGVNFPWLLYQIACGEKPKLISHYKIGTRLRWILGDLDSLYLVLRDKSFTYSEKTFALLSFLTPHPFKTRHEVNRLTDIRPFIWEIKKYLKDL